MPLVNITTIIISVMALMSCATTPRPDVILHEGPEGGVYLERIAARTIQAAQPIKLDRGLIARVLTGIQIGEPKNAINTLFIGNAKPERVFSDEDTAFLAPLISSAFSQATAEQQVRFRVVHFVSPIAHAPGGGAGIGSSTPQTGGPQKETTVGTLYAHGLSLHFTLSEYRHRVVKPDVISGPNRYYADPTGLREREVQFAPQSALRPDSYKQSDGNTLVIDYETLAKRPQGEIVSPAPAATAVSPSALVPKETLAQTENRPTLPPPTTFEHAQSVRTPAGETDEVQPLKDLVVKKDMELEILKKELRTLRRQLSERDAHLEGLRKKGKTAPKSSEAIP
ncbi:MAG: hypothetical protein M3Z35_08810 [Nitrospirota bacterium]|nr:hypothetical protein [Nitrospirota bacterium]